MQPSLFPSEPSNKSLIVTKDKIVQPLTQILEEVTSTSVNKTNQSKRVPQTITNSLDELFPEQRFDEKNIQKAKEILGSVANELASEQLKNAVIEIQYLTEVWLDNLERGIFDGVTLKELIHEKGGL